MRKHEQSTNVGPARRSIAIVMLGSVGLVSTAPAAEVLLPPATAAISEVVLTVPDVANDLGTIVGNGMTDLCVAADPHDKAPVLAPFCQ
jgi:hypothetical protein